MKRLNFVLLLIGVFFLSAVFSLNLQAQDSTPEPTPEAELPPVSLTIYNQGTALVQDRRVFELQSGDNVVSFTDVASGIYPSSVSFNSLTDPLGTFVLEQNYVFDLVDSSALLARYLDQQIILTLDDGTQFSGQLLSGRNGEVILRDANGQISVVSLSKVRDIQFPALPDGLITRPTLRWIVQSAQTGPQNIELTYLTGGLNWAADYVLLLNDDSNALNLNGWVTLTNATGATYTDAQVKLIAGDVNRLPEGQAVYADGLVDQVAAPAAARQEQAEQRQFNQYQLYELTRRVTVANNETKQVQFVSGSNIPATSFFVYRGSTPYYNYGYALTDQAYGTSGITDVQSWVEFSTAEDSGLGRDLPAGNVRVYQEDVDGSALLIGENRIDHTPKGEMVQLFLGNAFSLVGERIQTDFRLVSNNVLQETYEIRLRNRKDDEAVEIRVPETLFRWSNWQILNSSTTYTQIDSNNIEFRVTVAPQSETIITYTVQYSWP
jgi:hypothetical protein